MKRNLRFLAGAFLLTATALFTGCNSDDDFLMESMDSVTPQTRAQEQPDGSYVITFEEATNYLAGPTSYGDNLYSVYEGSQYESWKEPDIDAVFAINKNYGTTEFWNGGIAISDWSARMSMIIRMIGGILIRINAVYITPQSAKIHGEEGPAIIRRIILPLFMDMSMHATPPT